MYFQLGSSTNRTKLLHISWTTKQNDTSHQCGRAPMLSNYRCTPTFQTISLCVCGPVTTFHQTVTSRPGVQYSAPLLHCQFHTLPFGPVIFISYNFRSVIFTPPPHLERVWGVTQKALYKFTIIITGPPRGQTSNGRWRLSSAVVYRRL